MHEVDGQLGEYVVMMSCPLHVVGNHTTCKGYVFRNEAYSSLQPTLEKRLEKVEVPALLRRKNESQHLPHSPAVESDVYADPSGPSQRSSGTRYFPRYSLDTVQIKGFHQFLQSVDGKMRSENVATEITIDVSF